MSLLEIILIGISLSIDAFSLAISIGMYIKKESIKDYSFITGVYHFCMPLVGFAAKSFIYNYFFISEKILFTIVIIIIMVGIIRNKSNDDLIIVGPFLFGFTVSIDSLLVGVTLDKNMALKSAGVFSLVSFTYTYIGFKLSAFIRNKFSKYYKLISLAILLVILIKNII